MATRSQVELANRPCSEFKERTKCTTQHTSSIMGNVIAAASEESVRLLPFLVVAYIAIYVIIIILFGSCARFLYQLRSEGRDMCGYPPLPPWEPESREVLLAANGSRGNFAWGSVSRYYRRFVPWTVAPPPDSAEPAAEGAPTCPVCMLNWPNVALDCGHRVCAACLPQIQSRSNTCPVCRDPIRTVMQLYN
eukprot:TRINITY_DN49840_c0_g1_i1.p1 TRINITY_DN49840_c0_g1~~TRINITY_DN49840_c0_g1_i1.p1  ORF type:complete len:192 (-),score=7.75 TRINITY_DN49840_c0_g1_i1:126-701(-)